MKIFLLIIFVFVGLSRSDNHTYNYFKGTILINNGVKECYYQQISDTTYESLDIYYLNHGKDVNNIIYSLYINETKQIDIIKNVHAFNTSYNLEKNGIGHYKICFEVLDSWRPYEPILLTINLVKKKVYNKNLINQKFQNILPNAEEIFEKISESMHAIEMEQEKYSQHEDWSRYNAEQTFELVNYFNIAILIVMIITYSIHIYVIKALFDNNSIPAKVMRKLY
uniref:G-protein coupled receptors family 1 profile domain-containing protein n=1 Tax=Strongyloides stercoralis TaxID=6248 RepID=A0A0K0EHI9_STRER